MTNILKLRQGRNISKLEYELAIADYNLAYQQADDDMKAKLDGLMLSSKSFSSADPMNNRSAREYATQIYRNASKIARGEYAEAPGALTSTKNIFNGYSHRENIDNANYVTSRYLLKNSVPKVLQAAPVASKNNSNLYHRYNWANGLSSGWTLDSDTLEQRMQSFASTLSNNLNSALSAKNSGKKLIGVDENNVELALGMLQGKQWTKDNFKDLMKAAQLAGVDPSAFRDYFGDLFPGASAEEKAKQALIRNGYLDVDLSGQSNYIQNLAKNKGLVFMKDKAENIRAFNKDYTEYTGNPFTEFNDDWETEGVENGGYGDVMMMDDSGNVYMGKASDINNTSNFYKQYQNALTEAIAKRKNLHHEWNIGDMDDTSTAAALQALQNKFGHNILGSDVSKLFSGNDKIWVTDPSGQAFTEDAYGNARFKNTAKFYMVGDDGSVTETSFDALRSKYNRNGWDGEADYQLGQASDLDRYLKNDHDQFTYNDQMDLYGRTFGDALLQSYGIPLEATTLVSSVLFGSHMGNKAVDVAARELAKKQLSKTGKKATKKLIEAAAEKITRLLLTKAIANGSLRTALKKAGIKTATRLGIHGALAAGGLGTFGISTAIGAGLALGEAGIRYGAWDNINEHPEEFVHNLLGAVGNKGNGELRYKSKDGSVSSNAAFLRSIKYAENENDMIRFLYGYLQHHPEIELTPQELATWREMMRNYNSRYVQAQKEGGIIKASKGTYLDPVSGLEIVNEPYTNPETRNAKAGYQGLRKKIERANDKGFGNDIARMDASEAKMFSGNFNMSTADVLRISTMAQDVASIVASFVPGAGTGIAAGLGITALGTDLVADILDPAVSAGEVAKNAAINAGFAGLGLIPGAKMSKVVKNVVKYAPKIITAAAAMGIAMDESTQKTFAKLGDGTQKLNREDWRNLSHVLSLIAAGTRGIKGDIARRQVKKGIVNGDQVTIKGLTASDGKSPVSFSKEKIAEVNKALGEIKPKEEGAQAKALTILKEQLNLTDELATQVLNSPGFLKEKAGLGKFSIGEESLLDKGKSYDNLRAIWNKEAQNVLNSSEFGKWFANTFGGGSYTAKQRAILELDPNVTGIDVARLMQYKGNYNPAINYQGLRGKAGEIKIQARPDESFGLFSRVSQAQNESARGNLALQLSSKRAEIKEKAGVNEAIKNREELGKRIGAHEKAIEGMQSEQDNVRNIIASLEEEIRQAETSKKLITGFDGKRRRTKYTDPNTGEEILTITGLKSKLNKALKALDARFGSKQRGRAFSKEGKEIKRLQSLIEESTKKLESLDAKVNQNRISISDYNKQVLKLENDMLGSMRLLLRAQSDIPGAEILIKDKSKVAGRMYDKMRSDAKLKGIAIEGLTNSNKSIKTDSGSSVIIKKGATMESFEHLTKGTSEPVIPNGFIKLKLDAFEKVFTGMKGIRGAAYNPSTNKIIVWKDGGQINSKYSHLRK